MSRWEDAQFGDLHRRDNLRRTPAKKTASLLITALVLALGTMVGALLGLEFGPGIAAWILK